MFTSRDGTSSIDRRRERVVEPLDKNAVPYYAASDSTGPLVSAIGEKAGIIVGQRTKAGTDGKALAAPKFPSGHELRQAFGFAWFRRIMPPVLKELLRHSEIVMTMKFHARVDA